MQWFAFDSMGEFVFNESFNMMKSGKQHSVIVQQRSALALLGPLNAAIWIPRLAFAFLPYFWRVKDWNGMIAFCDSQMEKRLQVMTSFHLPKMNVADSNILRRKWKNQTSRRGSLRN